MGGDNEDGEPFFFFFLFPGWTTFEQQISHIGKGNYLQRMDKVWLATETMTPNEQAIHVTRLKYKTLFSSNNLRSEIDFYGFFRFLRIIIHGNVYPKI